MQDKQTGEMISMSDNTSTQMQNSLSDAGFCILSVGEKINIKGEDFVVDHFDKHGIMLKCPEDIYEKIMNRNFNLKINDPIKIKNGHFIVQHYGAQFLKLRGLPANTVINQDLITKARKQEIEKIRKES